MADYLTKRSERDPWDADDYLARGVGLSVLAAFVLGAAFADGESADWAWIGWVALWIGGIILSIGIIAKGVEVSRRS